MRKRAVRRQSDGRLRRRLDLRGQVQGVGFRPFVHGLASRLRLGGFVANNGLGAVVEVEGPRDDVETFERRLVGRLPPLARLTHCERRDLPPRDEAQFSIRPSSDDRSARPEVAPDAATCRDCLRELLSDGDRRRRYPFINCTNCGPRYSIIRDLPYDRPLTSMVAFEMCPDCRAEYENPADRRFHAQPNACPRCGPRLTLLARGPARRRDPLTAAATLLRRGRIVAIKGLGGYHLACRADSEASVRRLRRRKLRDGKPLALMVADLSVAARLAHLSAADRAALASPAAPIVLVRKRRGHGLAASIAPNCGQFGLMLPYTPLHLLLLRALGDVDAIVLTSGNLAGCPLSFRDDDALATLGDVADALLVHDREIVRPIDDSVVFTFRRDVVPVRRARGYAPRPLRLDQAPPRPGSNGRPAHRDPAALRRAPDIFAAGADLKSAFCLLRGGEATLSEHIGDLSHGPAYRHYAQAVERLSGLLRFRPRLVAHDMHPQYLSTAYALRLGLPALAVQHHHAHIASLMAEHNEPGPIVGLACDGVGHGADGAAWGCELLLCERGGYRRLGHHAYFPLIGGDAAARETLRPALALLDTAGRPLTGLALAKGSPAAGASRPGPDIDRLTEQLARRINTPPTSSLGRVFDAAAAVLGLCGENRHEAEAAMAMEAAAGRLRGRAWPVAMNWQDGVCRWSFAEMIAELLERRRRGRSIAQAAADFHETISAALARAAGEAAEHVSARRVGLSGGCFANRRLLTGVTDRLEARGLTVLTHREVPPGDGGVALGQAFVAGWRSVNESEPAAQLEASHVPGSAR